MAARASSASARSEPHVVVEQVDEIVLAGIKVQVRGQELPLDKVLLDPANPRVANTVAATMTGSAAQVQQKLAETLWNDPDVHQLYHAVRDNGGLIERIIVRSNLVVAEGNCRTVVYRKLRENFPDDPRWETIPARVLPADITDRQIAILLGELHVGGKNKWSPFEKAGHIYELSTRHGMVQDEIAKLLRTSKTAVNHNIHAFSALKNHYMPQYPGTGAVRKFSYFYEAYKDQVLREWLRNSPESLDDFVRWVGTNKLARGSDVRELKDIVENPRALEAFEKSGREAARKVLEQDRPELTSPLFKLMIEMTDALDKARLDDVRRVRKDKSGGAKSIVRNLQEALERFADLCDGVN
jgi:hypothetical protein